MVVKNPEVYVSISLTILGSSFTILTYLLFPDLRTNSRTFALWLAIGGLGFSSTVFFFEKSDKTQGLLCMIESFVESYFSLVTLFTTVIYCVIISKLFATLNSSRNVDRHTIKVKPGHVVFVWILPFFMALLPFCTGSYGRNRSDLYCWIKTDTQNETTNVAGYIWEIFVLYLWVIVAIVYTLYIYSTVVRRIHQWEGTEAYIVRTKAVVNRMMMYPFILAAVYTAPLFHRLLEPFGVNPRWLVRMSIFTLKIQGFLDAIAYGLSPAIVSRWKLVFSSIYAFFITGVLLSPDEEKKGLRDNENNRPQSTPEMFKHYRESSDIDIELTGSHSERNTSGEIDEDDEFENGMKQYDVYAGTDDQHKIEDRAKTFSITGLTNFYNDDENDY